MSPLPDINVRNKVIFKLFRSNNKAKSQSSPTLNNNNKTIKAIYAKWKRISFRRSILSQF